MALGVGTTIVLGGYGIMQFTVPKKEVLMEVGLVLVYFCLESSSIGHVKG